MKVKEVKLHEALTGGPDWDIRDLAKYLKEKKARQVYIFENGAIIGVVGMADIVYEAVANGNINLTAKDIMKSPVIHAEGDISIRDAYFLIANNNIMMLPVVDSGVVIGELSLAEAFEALREHEETRKS